MEKLQKSRLMATRAAALPSMAINARFTIIAMHRRSILSLCAVLALFGLILVPVSSAQKRGRKYKAPPPTAKIEVTVLKDFNGKPIENAAVIFHTLKEPGNMELKSNEDGKAMIDVLPLGETVRLQIIAKGYQTYGADYPIHKSDMAIEVRMKRPGEQYSIYKDHAGDKKDDGSAQQNKGEDSTDRGGDKPSDSSKPQ